jgi:phospholipid/cholesterol/gamma-HCH transport system substrate-binding protein
MPDASSSPPPVANLDRKAALLLVVVTLLVVGAVFYILYARGLFEPTQQLVLVAEDSEGVVVGMDMTFAGFPIGRVQRIELSKDGNAHIVVDVPKRDAHWLRESSVFTLVRGVLGNTNLRAYTGIPTDPPLPDKAERRVLAGDATAEVPQLVRAARELVQNLSSLTAADTPLANALANIEAASGKLKGQHGALGVLLGNDADARKVVAMIERSNALLVRLDGTVAKLDGAIGRTDGLIAKADTQLLGDAGLLREVRTAVTQLRSTLGEAQSTLTRADALLQQAQTVAANAAVATNDLGALRSEVEASLRKVQHLLDDIQRRWPFARDTELKLP